MNDDDRCCFICGAVEGDVYLCPLNDDDDGGDDFENSNCLDLLLWEEKLAARPPFIGPKPKWIAVLEGWRP